jgi:hypothetical protein
MMLCELITKPIKRLVEEEGKNLDEIAEEVCPSVDYGREKIIRVIKDFLGEEYLVQHAEVLGYDIGKAELAKKRTTRSHKKIDAMTDTVVESNSITPDACCHTTVQDENTEHRETGQTKGQEQGLEEPVACCQEKVVRKKIVSENRDLEEEITLEEPDNVAPKINVSQELLEAINKLIKLFSFAEVEQALRLAKS